MADNDRPARTGRAGRDEQTRIWVIIAAIVIAAVLIFYFLWPRDEVAAPGNDVVAPATNGDTVDVVEPADDAATDDAEPADEDTVDVVAPANDESDEPGTATPPGEARRAPALEPFLAAGVGAVAA